MTGLHPKIKNDVRKPGLDVIRVVAICSVVGGHFFMNTAFGRTPVNTPSMFVQGVVQYLLTTIGVPLFLMLTGYLNSTKHLSEEYFLKLTRVIVSYVVISLFTYAVLLNLGKEALSIKGFINGLCGFNIIRYGWYINMYIGLFLLIPAVNALLEHAWNDTTNCRAWIMLIGGGIVITSLPSTLNRYGFTLFPDYWRNGWVLCYYLYGALIRHWWPESPPTWFRRWRFMLWGGALAMCFVHPLISMVLHTGNPCAPLGGVSDLPGMVLTVVIFLSVYEVKKMPSKKAVSSVARLSLDMYLFSYIIDVLVYPRLTAYCPDQSRVFLYYLPTVGGILLCAWLLSWLKERIFRLCHLPKVLG